MTHEIEAWLTLHSIKKGMIGIVSSLFPLPYAKFTANPRDFIPE